MKKILIFLISLISFADCFSQVSPPIVAAGSNGQTLLYPNLFTGRSFRVPAFSDTISLNTVPTLDSAGKLAYTYDCNCLWFRQNAPHKWVRINSPNGNNGSDTLFAQLPAFFDSTSHPGSTILKILHPNGLLFGGTVTLDSCMSVDVQAGAIIINYNQINFAQTLGIVIPAADPSFGRVDAIIVDSSGRVFDSSGVASPTPVPVTINPSSQVLLTTINVPAGATCLPIIQGIIYDGISDFPAQWNTSTVGSISADFINTDNPFHLNQALFISTYTDGSGVIFTKPSGYDTAISGAILRFSLYLNGLMNNQLRAVLLKDGVPVTNNLVLNPYFNPNDSNQYQIPSVPLSAWSFTNRSGSGVFNGIEYSFGGNDLSGSKGLFIDYTQIQTGFSPQTKSFVDSTKIISGNEYYFINGIAYLAGPVGGGGGSSTLQIDFNNSVSAGDNPTIEMSGNDLIISQNGEQFLWLSPSALFSRLRATDGASANASIDVVADTASNTVQVQIRADKNTDVEGESQIILDGMASTIVMQSANGIILDDFLKLNTVPSGDISTDAVLTLNRSTGKVDTVSASSFGGSQTLQQVFDVQSANALLNKDDTVSLNNHVLFMGDIFGSNGNGILIVPNETVIGAAYSSSGNKSSIQSQADISGAGFEINATNNVGGFHFADIFATTDNTGSSISYQADTHTFAGLIKASNYGSGSVTGTPTFCPAFDASGNIIEVACASGSVPNFAFNENHTGSTSTTITLAHNYLTGTIRVFKNGVRVQQPTDYVEATANTITLSSAPLVTDNFTIDFNY